ncbi:MAG: T9SS type A sorting domain-containing protein [Chitinophagales bacterium]|nr:T9SS type A sorting domain-containing protein [Chitinophagales bacterium]
MEGIDSEFMIFEGGGHVPFLNLDISDLVSQANFIDKEKYDRVLNGIAEFLFKQVTCEKQATPTAIKDVKKLDVNIYPNPIENELRINMPDVKNWNVEIYDLSGKLIIKNSYLGRQIVQNTSQIPTGIHVVQISDLQTNEVYVGKFIKQ